MELDRSNSHYWCSLSVWFLAWFCLCIVSEKRTKQVVYIDRNAHIIELFVGGPYPQWGWAHLTTITGATLGL